MERRQFQKVGSCIGTVALVAVGVAALGAGPAAADDFVPENTAPTVDITSTTGAISASPTLTGSTAQTLAVDVGDADTLSDLNTVELCMYLTGVGDSTCASTDTTNAVKITWTRSTDTFAISPNSSTTWGLSGPVSGYVDTGLSMSMQFKFKVGAVARAGDWTVKVTATDNAAESTNDSAADVMSVNYFGAVTSQRASQSWTSVAAGAGAAQTKLNVSDGSLLANGASDVSMSQSAAFSMITPTVATASIAAGNPGDPVNAGEVALDCKPAATYSDSGAIRLSTTPESFQANVLTTGTSESGNTSLVNSCQLTSGGGLPVGTYSAAVVIGIGNH